MALLARGGRGIPPPETFLSKAAALARWLFLSWKGLLFSGFLQGVFSGARLRRPGGQGGFRPPPYAPLDPLYPLQTAEGYPRTPLVPLRALPLAPGPQEPSRAPHRVLVLVRRQSGAATGTPFSRHLRRGTLRRKIAL